jgi:peptide/nickel transport system permease protein
VTASAEISTLQRRARRAPATLVVGALIVGTWLALALLAPWLTAYDPVVVDVTNTLKPMSAEHWLGTDSFGRDVFARLLHGARLDLQMAFFGVVGPLIIGTAVGLLAAYYGGVVDALLMRVLDVTVSFPYFVLVIAIVAVLEPGLRSYYISLTLVNWVTYARLMRSQVLVLKNAEFVLAARTIGIRDRRIMLRHILPNAIAPSIVFVMTDAVLTIVLGSSLGFLGLGVQPPAPEWGAMIAEGQVYLKQAWWIAMFPGIAISTLALGFSLAADGMAKLLHAAQ